MPNQTLTLAEANDTLHLTAWVDPLVDRLGHDPRSAYVEQFWLGILGPSTVWFLRHCAHRLDEHADGFDLTLSLLAEQLGIGHRGGRNSPMTRAVLRACRFGAARPVERGILEVRRHLAPLNQRQVERLPEPLRARHAAYQIQELGRDDVENQRARARRLALGLVECGDRFDDAELQLGRWRFHPSIAAEAVRWAWERHCEHPGGLDAA